MAARRRSVESVRTSRYLTRAANWSTTPGQRLDLPVEAAGLSEVTVASGHLQLSPDYDLLALLSEAWAARTADRKTTYMRPTFYRLANDLYGENGPPGGKHYRDIRDALDRLAEVSISLWGFDAETGEADHAYVTKGHLLTLSRETNEPHGLTRPKLQLAEWLRDAIDRGAVIRLDWRTLRSFDRHQLLAKRLWVYLAAESWKPQGKDLEASWMSLKDNRLANALGMSYTEPRFARRALARAGKTIVDHVDPRYLSIEVVKRGKGNYQLVAERLRSKAWNRDGDELKRQVAERKAARSALAEAGLC